MGKIYRDGIAYAGGGNVKECTQAQYDEWKANGQLVKGVTYDITDAPNLNATAKQISYDGTTTTVKDKMDGMIKSVVGYANITASQVYSDYRYADIIFSDIDRTKVIGVIVIGTPTNRPAFAILMDGNVTKVRVYANGYSDNTSIPVRLVYLDI